MTLGEAENVFAKIIVKAGCLSGAGVSEVFCREANRSFARAACWSITPRNETSRRSAGCRAEEWLTKRAVAFGPEARAFGLAAPKGVLLLGVQGCGKRPVRESGVESLADSPAPLRRGRMFGSFVGSSEENIRRASPWPIHCARILWVDEIDKAFAGSQGSGASDGGTTAASSAPS